MRLSIDDRPTDAVRRAADVVRSGGVLLSPTDTIYGLACDPFQESAVERILALKGRRAEKGFLLLVEDPGAVGRLAYLPARFDELGARLWPGPVTVLLEARPEAPDAIVGREGKIGFRRPRDAFLQALLEALNGPLLSTSANRSGSPPAGNLEALGKLFEGKVDLFLDGGEPPSRPPSTVVDLTTAPPRVVRAGAEAERVGRLLSRWST